MEYLVHSELFERLRKLEKEIRHVFETHMVEYENDKHVKDLPGWYDFFYSSESIRKCHIKTIEPGFGKNKNLWLMHINIFPQFDRDLPIFGLDIVANPNKISGCFCDYSPTTETKPHPYLDKFEFLVKDLSWTRAREMPDWAQEIFSENIVGAGSIREGEETDQLCEMALHLIQFYLAECDNTNYKKEGLNTKEAQNKYCRNQKMNKMLHGSILAMGIEEDRKDQYVENVLFEEIV